jgi:hypothetical protein
VTALTDHQEHMASRRAVVGTVRAAESALEAVRAMLQAIPASHGEEPCWGPLDDQVAVTLRRLEGTAREMEAIRRSLRRVTPPDWRQPD